MSNINATEVKKKKKKIQLCGNVKTVYMQYYMYNQAC